MSVAGRRLPGPVFATVFGLLFVVDSVAQSTVVTDNSHSSNFVFWGPLATFTPSMPCDFCTGQLDTNLTCQGTWDDGQPPCSAELRFHGSGIVLYGATTSNQANVSFMLVKDGSVTLKNSQTTAPDSNNLSALYQVSSLSDSIEHVLRFSLSSLSGGSKIALIDYATGDIGGSVSSGNPTTTSTSRYPSSSISTSSSFSIPGVANENSYGSGSNKKSAIIGGAVGGASGLISICVIIIFVLKWRRRNASRDLEEKSVSSPYSSASTIESEGSDVMGFSNLRQLSSRRSLHKSQRDPCHALNGRRDVVHERVAQLEAQITALSRGRDVHVSTEDSIPPPAY